MWKNFPQTEQKLYQEVNKTDPLGIILIISNVSSLEIRFFDLMWWKVRTHNNNCGQAEMNLR